MRQWIIGLIGIGFVVLISSLAWAGSFTITSTLTQDGALQWVVDTRNAEIAAQNVTRAVKQPPDPALPLVTPASYLQTMIGQVLDSYAAQLTAVTDNQLKQSMDVAPDLIKAQVKNLFACGKVTCP